MAAPGAGDQVTQIPKFVLEHAPLLHLHSTDPYRPSSIAAQLTNTRPEVDYKPVVIPNPPLNLENLDHLNTFGGANIYLTSNDDITTNPKWLEGETDWATGDKSGVIITVDKGEGLVDAFYFYFFAFNRGGVVLEKQLGDHVGDWEHNMIRFINGQPKYIWLSQHANGEAFTFAALQKDASGKRPIVYCATGSHALYASAGKIDHTIPNFNLSSPFLLVDYTDAGPLYDPLLASYTYEYTAPSTPNSNTTGTFTPYTASDPVGYLAFTGHWGDAEYPADDPRQKNKNLFSFKKYVGGPTGPADKQLVRKEVWPENSSSGGQRIRTSIDGSSWFKDLFGKIKAGIRRAKMKKAGVKRVDIGGGGGAGEARDSKGEDAGEAGSKCRCLGVRKRS